MMESPEAFLQILECVNTDWHFSTQHRRSQRVQAHPKGDGKKIFSGHFCWNEAKIGLNLVRCTPADEIKR